MPEAPSLIRLKLDEAELQSRRAYFEITDEDLRRLASLRAFAEQHTDEIVEDLYALVLGHPGSRKLFLDHAAVERAKRAQRDYLLALFGGRCDLAYAEDRLRVGVAHERLGVPPKWYLGAYSRYLRVIFGHLARGLRDPAEVRAACDSILKLVAFDMAIAMETYMAAHLDSIARHEAAIRELSTPVLKLHGGALLLPLIGTVDTQRAEQLTQTVLHKVVEEKAKVIIIDIAGVPVVDLEVADHLLKTTEAVRLLGAQTILSGISPAVAERIVQLGVDVSAMHTRSQLADALELALEIVGGRVTTRGGRQRPAAGESKPAGEG